MTDIKLTLKDIASLLMKMAADMKGHIDELREMDAVIGDGDLGITIELGMQAITSYLKTPDETDTGKMLVKCGININKVNPSTFGTLLASAKRGRAEVGDKTMLDSLVPAVEAFQGNFKGGGNVIEALKAAASAAESGMQATANMRAKVGRGSYRQDGTIGVHDGGAAAIYYLIESFTRHLNATLGDK